MGKSQRLRVSDLRAIYRLVGECRELGDDATAWRHHLLAVIRVLFDAGTAVGGEGTVEHARFFIYDSEIPAASSCYLASMFAGEMHNSTVTVFLAVSVGCRERIPT
jgi:hypothetical protein